MKTARFTSLVERAGKPEVYLALSEPSKDLAFQQAVQRHRVLTVHQELVGTKTDHGEVGFEAGPSRQYLVFPKSLEKFTGSRVVGIDYGLLNGAETPKKRPPKAAAAPRPRKPPAKTEKSKVIPFPKAAKAEAGEPKGRPEIKKEIGRTLEELEAGKQVAAFNRLSKLLKRLS